MVVEPKMFKETIKIVGLIRKMMKRGARSPELLCRFPQKELRVRSRRPSFP